MLKRGDLVVIDNSRAKTLSSWTLEDVLDGTKAYRALVVIHNDAIKRYFNNFVGVPMTSFKAHTPPLGAWHVELTTGECVTSAALGKKTVPRIRSYLDCSQLYTLPLAAIAGHVGQKGILGNLSPQKASELQEALRVALAL